MARRTEGRGAHSQACEARGACCPAASDRAVGVTILHRRARQNGCCRSARPALAGTSAGIGSGAHLLQVLAIRDPRQAPRTLTCACRCQRGGTSFLYIWCVLHPQYGETAAKDARALSNSSL
eukprot:scaffold8109_cov110-Isochrysis_galbana.AAC.2